MPIEETITNQIPWLFQAVATSLITLALSLLSAYLIYLYKQEVIASVEIVVNTRLDPNTLDVVVTNHGRAAIVVTELKIHFPAQAVLPGLPTLQGPNFKERRFAKLRRKLKTQGSKNDLLEIVAEGQLSRGAFTNYVIKATETIRVEPHEKAARGIIGENLPPYLPKLEFPNPATLIPSCKIAKHKNEIWGSPVVIGKITGGEYDLPMVMEMKWK